MKVIGIVLVFIGLNVQAAPEKVSFYELSESETETVLKQEVELRAQHKYRELSAKKAARKKNTNVWVKIEGAENCSSPLSKFTGNESCAPKMLHYSEYLREYNTRR